MSQPEWTFIRFVNRVLRNLRKPTIDDVNSTTNSRIAKDVVEVTREEYQELCSRQDWHWLRKQAHLIVEAETNTTVSATNGNAGFTSAGSFPSYASFNSGDENEGKVKIQVGDIDDIYTIQPNASSLNIPIDRIYTGSTAVGAQAYIFKDTYSLTSNFGRFLTIHKYFGTTDIRLVGIQEFRERQFESRSIGVSSIGTNYGPQVATLIDERTILFWPWPKDQVSIAYDYIKVPNELNGNEATFEIPQDDMTLLLHRVMMIMYGYIEDDTRANVAAQLFAEKYSEMSGSKVNVDDMVHLQVINRDRAIHRRSRRGRYGSVDWGKTFDRWP